MMYLSGNLSFSRNQIRVLAFFIMINDLVVKNARLWKYVDDTTTSETVAQGKLIISNPNVLKIEQCNGQKQSPEMRISFTKSQQEFEPILINGDALEVVDCVKLLGLNISSDLTWNIYINETFKNGSKRLYIFWYNLRELRLLALNQGSSTLVVLD